jgi:hypothetical protein
MKIRLKLVSTFALVAMLLLAACSLSLQSATGLPATATHFSTTVTNAISAPFVIDKPFTTNLAATPKVMTSDEEVTLKAMIAQHQRVRSQLPAEYQQDLDRLTVQVKRQLFAALPTTNLLTSTAQIVNEFIPALTPSEAASLAEYILGGIASGDISDAALMEANKSMQEMQQSFNLQYLQLQNQMQDENRQFTMVSNIMKTKHDTVKNSINNIR